MLIADGTVATAVNQRYYSWSMATEAAVINGEMIQSGVATAGQSGQGWAMASLVIRSTGEVVAYFNGVQTKTSGTFRARVYYSRRTGVNTWSAPVQIDANASFDNMSPLAILGLADSIHLLYQNTNSIWIRALRANNTLATAVTAGGGSSYTIAQSGTRYVDGANVRCAYTVNSYGNLNSFVSGDSPSTTGNGPSPAGDTTRVFHDGLILYGLYRNNVDSDLYVVKSVNNGTTYGTGTSVFTGTVPMGTYQSLSVCNGDVYQSGNAFVLPYVVNDGGTWKYNEYPVRYLPVSNAWNVNDKTASITLSNNDKTATFTAAGQQAVRSTQLRANGSAGKYYVEFRYGGSAVADYVGVEKASEGLTSPAEIIYLHGATGTINVGAAQVGSLGRAALTTDVTCMAWDALTEQAWFRFNNGLWNNNAAADPATGIGGVDASSMSAANFALYTFGVNDTGAAVTVCTEVAEFTQVPPESFLSWMGEAIPIADAWSVNDKSASITLLNADKSMVGTLTGNYGARSTKRYAKNDGGKFYAEFRLGVDAGSAPIGVGLQAITAPVGSGQDGIWVDCSDNGKVRVHLTLVGTPLGFCVAGDVVSLAWDSSAALAWVRRNADPWNNNVAADPTTGVGGHDVSPTPNANHALWCEAYNAGSGCTIRTETAEFTQTTPTGFLSWMGEELVAPGWPVTPLVGASPVFSVPAFTQIHPITALPINLSVYSYTTAPIVQRHVLAAPPGTVGGVPVFGAILFKQVVPFSTSPLIIAPYVIGVPATMTQAHKIVAPAMAVPSWSYVSSAIAQTHVITPISKAAGLPVFGATGITLVVPMFADNFATSAPVISEAEATIRLAIAAASFATSGFSFANAVIHEINLLSAANLATGPPVEAAALIKQRHTLDAAALDALAPIFGASPLKQSHPCVAANYINVAPEIGAPPLGQAYKFTATNLAIPPLSTVGPPLYDAVAEGASVHIDFVHGPTAFVRGTGNVGIDTLIGNDPAYSGSATGYLPAALTSYGYDYQAAAAGYTLPAFIGALRSQYLSGTKSLIIKIQQSSRPAVDEFHLTAGNAGWTRNIWYQSDWTYVGFGSYWTMDQIEDAWFNEPGVPGLINCFGNTFVPSNRFEVAANARGSISRPLTDGDTPPANPLSIAFIEAGPIASITLFDTLSLAELQAKTVPVLYGEPPPLPLPVVALRQLHTLSTPVSLAVTPPVVPVINLSQAGVMSTAPLVVGSPAIGVGTFTQLHKLVAPAQPVASPSIGQGIYRKNILPAPITTAVPTISTPALTLAIDALGYAVLAPEIGAPALTKRLSANNLAASVPAIAAGVLKQAHALAPDPLTIAAPVAPTAYLGQAGVFSLVPLSAGDPVIGAPLFKQFQVLAADGLPVSAPSIGQGVYGRVIPAIALTVTAPSVGTGPVLRKVLTPSGFTSPAPTFPDMPWLAVSFTAVDLAPVPVLGVGQLGQKHVFIGSSIAVLPPLTSPVVLGQAGVLQFMPLVAGQPTFTIPLLKQRHVLTSTAAAVELLTIDATAIGQEHRFDVEDAPQSIAVSAPVLGTRAIGQTHRLTAVLAPVAPVLAVVLLQQENQLGIAIGFSVTTPTVNVATFGQGHLVTAQGVTGPSPFVGTSALGKVVQAEALAVGSPVITAPQSTVVLPAALPLVTGKPALDTPDCGAISGFGLPTLATSPPVIGAPLFKQRHQLDAEVIAVEAPVLPAPSFKAPEIIVVPPMQIGAPVFSRPTMAAYANLTASNFTVVAISLPHIPMGVRVDLVASDLAIVPPDSTAPDIGQHHKLATTRIMPYPAIGEAQLGQDHSLTAGDLVAGRPVIRAGFFGQAGTMAAVPLWVASPELPALAPRERHALAAIGVAAGAPSLGLVAVGSIIAFPRAQSTYAGRFKGPAPVLGQAHRIIASTVTAGAPRALLPKLTASAPMGQPGEAVAGSPALGAPLMAVSSRLVPVGIRFGYPSLGGSQLAQEHVLAARDLEVAGPLFEAIGVGAADLVLEAIGIETAPPVLGEPRPPSRRARLYAIANVTGKRGNHVTITGRRHRTAI